MMTGATGPPRPAAAAAATGGMGMRVPGRVGRGPGPRSQGQEAMASAAAAATRPRHGGTAGRRPGSRRRGQGAGTRSRPARRVLLPTLRHGSPGAAGEGPACVHLAPTCAWPSLALQGCTSRGRRHRWRQWWRRRRGADAGLRHVTARLPPPVRDPPERCREDTCPAARAPGAAARVLQVRGCLGPPLIGEVKPASQAGSGSAAAIPVASTGSFPFVSAAATSSP